MSKLTIDKRLNERVNRRLALLDFYELKPIPKKNLKKASKQDTKPEVPELEESDE